MYTNASRRSKNIITNSRGPHNSLDHIEGRGDSNTTTKRTTVGHHTTAMRYTARQFHSAAALHEKECSQTLNSPKSVFNGKRPVSSVHRPNSYSSDPQSPQHEEIVKYLTDAWNRVTHDMESRHPRDNKAWNRVTHDVDNRHPRGNKGSTPTWYKEKSPNPQVENFKPFDLEKWHGQRTIEKIRGTT